MWGAMAEHYFVQQRSHNFTNLLSEHTSATKDCSFLTIARIQNAKKAFFNEKAVEADYCACSRKLMET